MDDPDVYEDADVYEDVEYLTSTSPTPSNMPDFTQSLTPSITSSITPSTFNQNPPVAGPSQSQKKEQQTPHVPKRLQRSRYNLKVSIVLHPLLKHCFLIFLILFLIFFFTQESPNRNGNFGQAKQLHETTNVILNKNRELLKEIVSQNETLINQNETIINLLKK